MGPYNVARDRKCEICDRIFFASREEVRAQQYKCPVCRAKPEEKIEITRGESESWTKKRVFMHGRGFSNK